MNEAVEMADEFLDSDKLVVYTQGVNNKKREYRCRRDGLFEKGKLSILVDEFLPVPVKYWQVHCRIGTGQLSLAAGHLVKDWCRNNIH